MDDPSWMPVPGGTLDNLIMDMCDQIGELERKVAELSSRLDTSVGKDVDLSGRESLTRRGQCAIIRDIETVGEPDRLSDLGDFGECSAKSLRKSAVIPQKRPVFPRLWPKLGGFLPNFAVD